MSELPPSGLRPPTKIGRPCSNNQPKPAVPQSPKGDGDTSTVRKISNEVAKKKLIDVDDGLSDLSLGRRLSIDRKSSQGSDSLWADVRKLSEAGVRRASDSSIVLTEDTDSFIIGDRVWVGGTKPGQIAYIGETQFAPGDWAGIVLDEPIGKNDGSVAGIRYFQCENRKGIFSRLTRLSRRPLTTNEDGLVTPLPSGTTPVSPGSSTSRISSPISPTGSITMPIGHTGSRGGSELKVGDRVIVMNSNAGSKAGMLRYIGTTQFAAGEWCGVELDDPLGKNDGSVQGVRYFECQDKFGLFAPLHKVSLSPSSSRRPSCAMHHGGTGLKKFGSKESISSVTSMSSVRSAARKPPSHSVSMTTPSLPKRTPLQDIIKEKDIYIEQLLKERDLEKSEGILAASRIEAAEHKCDVLNQELVQFREEVEARDIDMQNFVKQLQEKNKELTILLDDERKHSEDLQFRFEEESINKGEVEVSNLMKEDRISQLEQLLKNEQVQREQLEKESNELEETISKLRVCQEESDDKLSHLKASNEVNEKLVEQLKEQMDMSSVQLEETLSKNRKQEEEIMQLMSTIETSKMLAVQKQDELAHKLTIEIETLNKKIIGFETTIKDNESNKENLIKEINDIKASSSKQIDELKKGHEQELDRLKKLLREKEENLKNIEITSKSTLSELESIKNILKKEKLEGDAKVQGLTLQLNKLQETCVEKEKEIFSLIENLSKVESLVKAKDEEMKGLKESAETTERNFKKEVEALLNELKMKERNISEHTNSFEELELKLRSEIDKTSLNINDKELEINNLKRNIELKQEQHDIELKEKEEKYDELRNLLEMNKKQFGEQIENLSKELSHNQNTIKENEIKMSKLLKQIEDEKNLSLQKEEEIKKSYGRELENLQQKLTETELKATNYENCFKSENVEFNEIKEILKKENESAKLKILQLENELCLIKENCVKKEEEIIDFKKLILEMENNTKLKEEDSLSFKKSFIEAELTFKKQIENLENKIKISENEFKLKEDALHSENLEMKNIVEKTQKECLQFQNKSNNFETYVQENNHKMDFIIKDNENKIKNLMAELELKKTDYELAVKQKDDKIRELEINNQDSDDKQVQLTNKCNDYENQCKAKEVIIENLKKELEERKMAALSNSEETKAYFRNEIETIGKKFAESEVICKKYEYDLENGKKELDKLKAIYERENKENVDKVIDIEKQLQVSKDSCESKSKEILDLKEKISEMETAIQLKNEEAIGLKKCSLKTENDFRKDIEDIQNKCNKNETELKNNENNLKKTIDELNTDIIEGKAKYTELEIRNKQLETDLKEKTNEIDIQMAEKHKLSILLNSLESNKSDHHELLKEKQDKLIEMNEELEKHKLEMIEQHKVLQDLRQRLNESDQRFNTQRELVVQQEHDLSTMRVGSENGQKQISRLTSDIADWKNKLKTSEEKCSLLNEQKFKLEKDLESLKNSMSSKDTVKQHTSATTNGNDEDINYQMQIDFLNSVIVGLQHDKEALNAQILFLETGGVSTTNGNGSGRQITPRLYCDICEVFDAHETEDCPKQISESPPPQQAHKPFPRGYQRPYCEDCEMFGHETGECEDLTF